MNIRNFFTGRAIVFLILLGVIGLVSAFYSFNDYIYQEKQGDSKTSDESPVVDEKVPVNDVPGTTKPGLYEAYSPDKLVRAETGDVVLFFHASWCPSCRGLSADIEKNLGAIPSEVSILKVDYDTESELKKKYGVTYQHTFVQVDANGNMIKKWSASPTLNDLVSRIN